jgi:hypothetical protein
LEGRGGLDGRGSFEGRETGAGGGEELKPIGIIVSTSLITFGPEERALGLKVTVEDEGRFDGEDLIVRVEEGERLGEVERTGDGDLPAGRALG